MRFLKAMVAGRLRAGLTVFVLCASMLGASGCSFDEGYIKDDGKRLGEWTQASAGVLVVLYRSTGGRSYNIATSEALLALYRHYRSQGFSTGSSSVKVLRFMRGYCGSGYAGDRCRDATGDDEASDFYNDSLVPIASRAGECIAVHIRSGENWTTRSRTDRHCIPN
jgi:hypothetical protein